MRYVQSKRFSKGEKEFSMETFDTNSTAFAKPFSVFEMKITISKLLFLSGAIVAVSCICIEKYSFYQTLNETWRFFALCSKETLAMQARRQWIFNENGDKFCVSDRQQKA